MIILAYDGSIKIDTKIDTSGFESGVTKLKSLAKTGLSLVGTVAAAATGGLLAAGTAAVKSGSEFEATMSKVSAISGTYGSELEALTQKAMEMGAATKFSASESAEAFQYMAMAGWKTTDMLNGIDGIMSLAAADGLDLATTSDIVTVHQKELFSTTPPLQLARQKPYTTGIWQTAGRESVIIFL